MVDIVHNNSGQTAGMTARLKVSAPASARMPTGLTSAETRLGDLVTLSTEAKTRLQDARKLDDYLRIFQSALKILNGGFSRYVPQTSKVEVEFIAPKKSPGFKTDI